MLRVFINSKITFLLEKLQSNPPDVQDLAKYRTKKPETSQEGYWTVSARVATICCFPSLLRLFGLRGANVQQAWREKVPDLLGYDY